MELEEDIKNLSEIIQLCEDDIKNNNNNVTATLDLEDLKSLQTVLEALKKLREYCKELIYEKQTLTSDLLYSIPKKKIKELVSYLKLIKRHIALNDEEKAIFDTCIEEVQKLLEDK